MKRLLPFLLITAFSVMLNAQSLSGKHHIKYLEINTVQSDFGATFLEEDKLVFTSPADDRSKNPQLDLFVGDIGDEGEIKNKQRVKGLIAKTISKNGIAFSPDKKTVYFSAISHRRRARKNDRHQLFTASVDSTGNWTDISKLSFNNKSYSYEHPSISKDGTKLYFVSNMPSSLGGKDIFVVTINPDNSYGSPANLGSVINTSGDEVTPFISDKNILYFSSNGHEGSLGNLDIYASEVFENSLSTPFHLEAPVNSMNDDFAYLLSSKNDRGYFSSNRLQGQNNNDIYAFTIEEIKEEKCLQEITGIVKDKATLEVLKNAAITLFDEEGNQVQQVVTDENGVYSLSLDCSNTFTLVASSLYYDKEEHVVNTANYVNAPTLEADKFLSKTDEDAVAVTETKEEEEEEEVASLNSIYFDFDRYAIKQEATSELDKIVQIMKENTKLHVEVSSYTDSRGTSVYNQGLSERRAKATIDYIVSQGVDRSRLKGKGYGESRMLNKCVNGIECSEKAHSLNRRTEFAILNPQAYQASLKNTNKTAIASTDSEPKKTNIEDKKPVTPVESDSSLSSNTTTQTEPIDETQSTSKEAKISDAQNQVSKETDSSGIYIMDSEDEVKLVATKTNAILEPNETNNKTVASNPEKNELIKNVEAKNKELSEIQSEKKTDDSVKEKKWYREATTNVEKNSASTNEYLEWRKEMAKKKEEKQEAPVIEVIKAKENDAEALNTTDDRKATIQANVPKNVAGTEKENTIPVVSTTEEKANTTKKKSNSSKPLDEFFDSISTEDSEAAVTPNLFTSDHTDRVNNDSTSIFDNRPKVREYEIPGVIEKNTAIKTTTIDVSAMNIRRNGKHLETGIARNTHAIRVNFKMYSNRDITPGNKEVFIVIQNPEGEVINQKGTFNLRNGNEIPYTDETTTFYDNSNLGVSILSDRFIQKFVKGTYIVQIYIERYLTGQTFLILG